jgi:hypothetical protein
MGHVQIQKTGMGRMYRTANAKEKGEIFAILSYSSCSSLFLESNDPRRWCA